MKEATKLCVPENSQQLSLPIRTEYCVPHADRGKALRWAKNLKFGVIIRDVMGCPISLCAFQELRFLNDKLGATRAIRRGE